MAEEAKDVLRWASEELEKSTWPREDYREFLMLVVVSLGGSVEGFQFRVPGADHHARWMSKGIYVMKIQLLSEVFKMTAEEKEQIRRIFVFTVVLYARPWLQSSLPKSAARQDLTFHLNVLRYRYIDILIFHTGWQKREISSKHLQNKCSLSLESFGYEF